MAYVIVEPCINVKDRACVEVCPVDCIYEGADQLFIHPDECIDCGACEPVCPVKAIFAEDETPEQWRHLIEATLHQVGGNRTRAARALGLQRTYLLRLIRDLGVAAPPAPQRKRVLNVG